MEPHNDEIEQQLKLILKQNNHTLDQNKLIKKIDAPEKEILQTLHNLINQGKICYNIDFDIDGKGKTYTTGLTEE